MFRDEFWLCLALTLRWSIGLVITAMAWLSRPYVFRVAVHPCHSRHIIFVYGGKVFIQGARRELSGRKPGMMTLVSLGIVVAFASSPFDSGLSWI